MKFAHKTFPIADRDVLIKWHEPNTYFRKRLITGKLNLLLLFTAIVLTLILIPSAIRHNPEHEIAWVIFPSLFIFIVLILGIWFGSASSVVRIKSDRITKSGRSYFKNIESCNVHSENYKGTKFFVLKFNLKENDFSFLKPKQVSEVVVPENVNLNQVLQILRDKGVSVIEGQMS